MNKHILFNPTISTFNRGDGIISALCKHYLDDIIEQDSFVVRIRTHLPLLNCFLVIIGKTKLSFYWEVISFLGIMDSNFIQWYIVPKNVEHINNLVLRGAGRCAYGKYKQVNNK